MKKILLSISALMTVASLNAQTNVLTANDAATFGTWSTVDVDADTYDWGIYDFAASTATHLNPLGEAAGSQSWDPTAGPLTPDNLLISPATTLPASSAFTSMTLTWDAASAEDAGSSWAAETYSVYLVTDPNTVAAATPVWTGTLADGGTVYNQSVDIAGYAGTTSYLVFRHHNTNDMNLLVIDNVSIDYVPNSASINENTLTASVYPNPANDVLNIKLNENATSVSIIGLDGKVVATQHVNATTAQVNVSNLVAGVYVYEIVAENGAIVRNTFVKK